MNNARLQLLLVEDNEQVILLTTVNLQDEYAIKTVSTLKDAKDQLKFLVYDIILLDLNLPDSAGFDTLDAVQELVPRTPICVWTADSGIGAQCIIRGAQDYFLKGVTRPDDMLRGLHHARYRHMVRHTRTPLETAVDKVEKRAEIIENLGKKL